MTYNADMGVRVVHKVRHGGLSQRKVASHLKVSRKYVADALARYDEDGSLSAVGNVGTLHRDRRFDPVASAALLALIEKNDALTPADYVVGLAVNLHRYFSADDVWHEMRRLGLTLKTRTKQNRRASLQKQLEFRQKMFQLYTFNQLVFIDEASFDRKNGIRSRGWAQKGCRTSTVDAYDHRGERLSLIMAVNATGVPTWALTPGTVDGEVVERFFTEGLLPHVGIHDNTVIVLDNAAVHHKNEDRLKAILEDKNPNAYLEFLPPYSPILNPIELFFAILKNTATMEPFSSRLRYTSEPLLTILRDLIAACIPKWSYRFFQTEPCYCRGLEEALQQ